jgi:hypothetical protein
MWRTLISICGNHDPIYDMRGQRKLLYVHTTRIHGWYSHLWFEQVHLKLVDKHCYRLRFLDKILSKVNDQIFERPRQPKRVIGLANAVVDHNKAWQCKFAVRVVCQFK